jgi:hypothetical protein
MPVMPTTPEGRLGGWQFEANPGKKFSETHLSK